MHEHQAQRTLVKSRPELWAEVSDVTSLGKHLGDFGEITITRLEPETTVAWEGTAARGTVELESSGWGTKVTLTAELLDVDVDADAGKPEGEAVPEPEPVAVVEPLPVRERESEPDPEPVKLGFFARLFRRKPAVAPASASASASVQAGLAPEPEPEPEPVAVLEATAPAAMPPVLEPPLVTPARLDAELAVEVLSSALDDLGAAHRRPFSH